MRIVNIFADASINTTTKVACAGAIAVSTNFKKIIQERYMKQVNATNNSAEILAIALAVKVAIEFKQANMYDKFRIYSDSKLCIYSLREWVFRWVYNQDKYCNLIKSDGETVSNQEYIRQIVRLIIDNNLDIEFYHQKGHVTATEASLRKSHKFFTDTNYGVSPELLGTTVEQVSMYNNMVDKNTKEILRYDNSFVNYEAVYPFAFYISIPDIEKYKKLINSVVN